MTQTCSSPDLQALLDACADFRADIPPDDPLRQASGIFLRSALKDPSLIEQAIIALEELSPDAISWMALIFGSYAENGGRADLTVTTLVSHLRDWCDKLPAIPSEEDELPDPDEAQTELLRAMPFLCQSIVGHLGRLPQTQETLARDVTLLKRLDELVGYSHSFMWVYEALIRWSSPLLILHVPSGTGMRLQIRNVSNCFHLFSLIQCAVGKRLPGGQDPSPALTAAPMAKARKAVRTMPGGITEIHCFPPPKLKEASGGKPTPVPSPASTAIRSSFSGHHCSPAVHGTAGSLAPIWTQCRQTSWWWRCSRRRHARNGSNSSRCPGLPTMIRQVSPADRRRQLPQRQQSDPEQDVRR